MIEFTITMAVVSFLFAVLALFIKQKAVTSYRGGVMIVISCLYFSILFLLAHFMSEGFK